MPRVDDRILRQNENLCIGRLFENLFISTGKISPPHGPVKNEIPAKDRAKARKIK